MTISIAIAKIYGYYYFNIYDYKLDIRWFCYFFYVNTIIYGKIIALEQYF